MTIWLAFAAGAALAAAASWFYYTHSLASKMQCAISSVQADVAAVSAKVDAIKKAV